MCIRDSIKIDQRGIQLNELVESKADAVHISPSHQFPTGRVMPISRRTHLLKWAINNKKYIIEDDYDSESVSYTHLVPRR